MLTRCFKLTAPMRFELSIEDVDQHNPIATPEYIAVSDADIERYQGINDYRGSIVKSCPLCLVDYAVGRIMRDPKDNLPSGSHVVMLPRGEGFSRELISLDRSCMLPVEASEPVWVLTEAVASACAAIRRGGNADHPLVWGSDVDAYITALTLCHMNGSRPLMMIDDEARMGSFDFAEVHSMREYLLKDSFGVAYVTVNNAFISTAVSQALALLRPEGTLVLSRWQEGSIAFHTGHILQKELHIAGSLSNTAGDYAQAMRLMAIPAFRKALEKLVLGTERIANIREFYAAFEAEARSTALGKTVYRLAF